MITRTVFLEEAVRAGLRILGAVVAAAVLLLLAWCSVARAQGGALTYGAFSLTVRAPDLTATTTSQQVALGASVAVARVCNLGPDLAYVALGGTTITVTAGAGILVIPGTCANLAATGATNMAAVSASILGAVLQTMLGSGNP